MNERMNEPTNGKPVRQVMPSEFQIRALTLKAQGLNTGGIAEAMGVPYSKVGNELYIAYKILGVENGARAVAVGLTEGWIVMGEVPAV